MDQNKLIFGVKLVAYEDKEGDLSVLKPLCGNSQLVSGTTMRDAEMDVLRAVLKHLFESVQKKLEEMTDEPDKP